MAENRFFIGVDDTDSPSSKGTGYLTRELCRNIEKENLGKVLNITRHQLLISDKIKYTNRNNAACIEVNTADIQVLSEFCVQYLKVNSEKRSNPVIVICPADNVSEETILFGLHAKKKVMTISDAENIVKSNNLLAYKIKTGKNGQIGALAAVGLRATGNDGRVIWVKGHEIKGLLGNYLAGEVYCETHVDTITTKQGYKIPNNASIDFDDSRIKPILKENAITLIVEELSEGKNEELSVSHFKATHN